MAVFLWGFVLELIDLLFAVVVDEYNVVGVAVAVTLVLEVVAVVLVSLGVCYAMHRKESMRNLWAKDSTISILHSPNSSLIKITESDIHSEASKQNMAKN